MTRLELLMVLYSLQILLNEENYDKALDLINKVIAEAEKN